MRNSEMAGLARTLSRDCSLTVTFDGERSYCDSDGTRINIASMPYSERGRQLMCGLVYHEIGHKNHTTGDRPEGFLGALTNIIEDVRVESLTLKERPGTCYDLDAVLSYYADKRPLQPNNLSQALLGYVMALGRGYLLRQGAILAWEQPAEDFLVKHVGKSRVDKLRALILSTVPHLSSTTDSEDCAHACLTIIFAQQKDGESPHDHCVNQEQEEQGDQEKSSDDATGAKQTPSTAGIEDQLSALEGSDIGDIQNFITAELDEIAHQGRSQTSQPLPQYPAIEAYVGSDNGIDQAIALSVSAQLRSHLYQLLQSFRNQYSCCRSQGRSIAPRKLAQLSCGDAKIFKKKAAISAVNTAVMLLLDNSGSMVRKKGTPRSISSVATAATFSLHHALYSLAGVSVATIAFSNPAKKSPPLKMLCDFGNRPEGGQFSLVPEGGTPIAAALWYAHAALNERSEPRKVIFLLTDGKPNDPLETEVATRYCQQHGIDIYALGIMSDEVKSHWCDHIVVNDLDQLPEQLFALFAASQNPLQ